MLYTLEQVKANLRTRQGSRVFFLGEGDKLTSAAKDFLSSERIPILPASQAKIHRYVGLDGAYYEEKPEHMTQLEGNILVPKTHPRILFRGKLDSLQAQVILLILEEPELQKPLEEILGLLRRMLKNEVLGEPFVFGSLFGKSEQEIREISQLPQKHLGIPHFMPGPQDGLTIARLNCLRTRVREAELLAVDTHREDLIKGLNRLSSAVYILMLQRKGST